MKINWFENDGRFYLKVGNQIVGWYRKNFITSQFHCVYTEGCRRDHECEAEADARGWLLKETGGRR